MMRNYFCMLILIGIGLFACAVQLHAYTMADYWMLNTGNVWIYDRDLFAVGSETHTFGAYTGNEFFDARGFCDNHPYIYKSAEGITIVGSYNFEDKQWVDLSANPVKLADAEMTINDSVSSTIPAGVLGTDPVTLTAILEAVETITVPAGTFDNALRVKIYINESSGAYTEKVWLAKGVGIVRIQRVSEENNTDNCFFTCGSLYCGDEGVEDRYIRLKEFIRSDENCWKDVNGDNKIGFEEAIHALQLVSGTTSQ